MMDLILSAVFVVGIIIYLTRGNSPGDTGGAA